MTEDKPWWDKKDLRITRMACLNTLIEFNKLHQNKISLEDLKKQVDELVKWIYGEI